MWLRTRGHDFELQLLRMNLTNETYCSLAFYICQGGYEIVVCLFVSLLATLCKNFQTDFHEIFMEGLQWANEQMIKFGGDPDHGSGPDMDPGLYRDTGKTCLGRGMHSPSVSS